MANEENAFTYEKTLLNTIVKNTKETKVMKYTITYKQVQVYVDIYYYNLISQVQQIIFRTTSDNVIVKCKCIYQI